MDMLVFRTVAPIGVATLLALLLVGAPVILYVIARWRAARDGVTDTQLGLKLALHHFAISAFQLGLAGAALLIYTLISPGTSDKGSSGLRTAIGFIIPAGIILVVHIGLLKRTNDEAFPAVRRLFWGYNLLLTGLVASFALVLGFQALFAKGFTGGTGHMAGSMVVVYGTAWAVVGFKYGQLVLGGGASSGGGHVEHHAPPPVLPTPPAQTQTGLPVLGGGSFPPIDPK